MTYGQNLPFKVLSFLALAHVVARVWCGCLRSKFQIICLSFLERGWSGGSRDKTLSSITVQCAVITFLRSRRLANVAASFFHLSHFIVFFRRFLFICRIFSLIFQDLRQNVARKVTTSQGIRFCEIKEQNDIFRKTKPIVITCSSRLCKAVMAITQYELDHCKLLLIIKKIIVIS